MATLIYQCTNMVNTRKPKLHKIKLPNVPNKHKRNIQYPQNCQFSDPSALPYKGKTGPLANRHPNGAYAQYDFTQELK